MTSRPRTLPVAALATLALLGHADRAAALQLAGVAIRHGPAESVDDANVSAAGISLRPATVPAVFAWLGGELHYDLTLARIGGPRNGIEYLHLGPTWRYVPDFLWSGGFVEIGTSITRLSNDRVGERELGGRWHFTSHVTLGHAPGGSRAWYAALRLQHTSNADLRATNPGLNVAMLELGYRF